MKRKPMLLVFLLSLAILIVVAGLQFNARHKLSAEMVVLKKVEASLRLSPGDLIEQNDEGCRDWWFDAPTCNRYIKHIYESASEDPLGNVDNLIRQGWTRSKALPAEHLFLIPSTACKYV